MGRFTAEEIERYAREWRGSLTPMLNYYRALRRTRGLLSSSTQQVTVPVLLLWSEREPVFVRPAHEEIGDWVPRLRIERVAGAGHFAQRDAPERVSQLLTDFAREGGG